jgi:hypothetical protein
VKGCDWWDKRPEAACEIRGTDVLVLASLLDGVLSTVNPVSADVSRPAPVLAVLAVSAK